VHKVKAARLASLRVNAPSSRVSAVA